MRRDFILKLLLLFLLGAISGVLFIEQIYPKLESLFVSEKPEETGQSPTQKPKKELKLCQIKRGKSIEVDLANQKLMLCQDGESTEDFLISTGKKEEPTPTGSFNVIRKSVMLYSGLSDCWLPFWVGFSGDYGFHELPICEGGQKRVGEGDIGQPASVGCVRLKIGEAETFYNFSEIGTPVLIYGNLP